MLTQRHICLRLVVRVNQAYPVHAAIVSNVGNLEAMMVPPDYTKKLEANIPGDFDSLPRLLGRASVSEKG